MAELSDDQKLEITMALAAFARPSEVKVMLREEHGIEVELTQIVRYNATKACFEGGDRLREVFLAARQAYLSEVATIPIAQQAYRLNELQRLFDKSVSSGNRNQAMAILKQAAEEVGGAFSNVRNLNVTKDLNALTPEERRAQLATLIDESFGRGAAKATAPTTTATQ